ncbi:MarC family protein, partial [Ancrocorticia sp.]
MSGFDGALFASTFTTLFVIADPFGNLPVFLALTSRMTPKERKRAAWQATLTSLAVLTVFGLFGQYILGFLHISVEAMQLSGGLL